MYQARPSVHARLRRPALWASSTIALLVSGALVMSPAAADTAPPAESSPPDPAVVLADWGTAPLPYEVATTWESDETEQAVLVVRLLNLDDVAISISVDSPFGPARGPVVVPADESRELRIPAGVYHATSGSAVIEVRDAVWGTAEPLTIDAEFTAFSALRPPRGDVDPEAWVDVNDGLVRIGATFTNTGPHAVQAQLTTAGRGATSEQTIAPGASAEFELATGATAVPASTSSIVATKTVDGETLSATIPLDTPETVNRPPEVAISDPGIAADVIGRFQVTGAVSDDYGLGAADVTAALVPVDADGAAAPAVETVAAPLSDGAWSATFNALDLPGGSYRVLATAIDNAGQKSTVERDVTVLDAPDSPPGVAVLSDDNAYDGLSGDSFTVTANLWWGQNGTTFRLYENGELVATRSLTDVSPEAQVVSIPITGKPNGTYVYTCELENARGITPCGAHTVEVTQATPGVPKIRHDYRQADGALAITASLWWGTNATSWTLFEDGVAIASGELVAATPDAQEVVVPLPGRPAGTHVYRVEFANAFGVTSSRELAIPVR